MWIATALADWLSVSHLANTSSLMQPAHMRSEPSSKTTRTVYLPSLQCPENNIHG